MKTIKATIEGGVEIELNVTDEVYSQVTKSETKRYRHHPNTDPLRELGTPPRELVTFLNSSGIVEVKRKNKEAADFLYDIGNYFRDTLDAVNYRKYLIAMQKIKDSGDEIDWESGDDKWYICYDHSINGWKKSDISKQQDLVYAYYNSKCKAVEVLQDKELMDAYRLVMNIKE